jgi:aromatic ring-cleaving dioxygenase
LLFQISPILGWIRIIYNYFLHFKNKIFKILENIVIKYGKLSILIEKTSQNFYRNFQSEIWIFWYFLINSWLIELSDYFNNYKALSIDF